MDIIKYFVLITLILLECIWIVTYQGSIQELISETFTRKRLPLIISILFLIFINFLSSFYFPLEISYGIQLIGLVFFSVGFILAVWAKIVMKHSWGYPGQHNIKKQDTLITTGPFSFSRNPIYIGIILIAFGFPIAIKSSLFFLSLLVVFHFYKESLQEEKLLEKYFGKQYILYKSRVPRFL